MSHFIDRRLNAKNKSMVNRQRFLRRFKQQIKAYVQQAISKRSITGIDNGGHVSISRKDMQEPVFQHGHGGIVEQVHPGNKEFIQGQRIPRPNNAASGQGSSTASNEGEGEDNFVFEISRREFLDIFFEDLALPDLVKKQIGDMPDSKLIRAGFAIHGTPSNINVVRSIKQATARRIALGSAHKSQLYQLQQEIEKLTAENNNHQYDEKIAALLAQIKVLKQKITQVPFIDTYDLRYNNRIRQPMPSTRAVMFCLMDVSGSMDETKKDIAKRFFILLYLFLNRNYQHIEIVFIRHHTSAKEVDEQEFFYSRETGGTVVSSALELMRDIIQQRYSSSSWNIYGAQASDGDNWNADSPYCKSLLIESIMPHVQYFSYVEIMPRHHQSLWEAYMEVKEQCSHFAMQHIDNLQDIYPVFRELFQRHVAWNHY
jgi:uncharacterized protein